LYTVGSPPSVFVSHSKYDTESVSYFSKIFANVGLKARFMEWERLEQQYAGARIADIIRSNVIENVRAVIVLLGKNLKNPPSQTPQYTHNWVNFEVGVSAGCQKSVWVFENGEELVEFPIPYVTDYVLYRLEDIEHLRTIGELLSSHVLYHSNKKPAYRIKCPHQNCNAEYNFWTLNIKKIHCPVCRREIALT